MPTAMQVQSDPGIIIIIIIIIIVRVYWKEEEKDATTNAVAPSERKVSKLMLK